MKTLKRKLAERETEQRLSVYQATQREFGSRLSDEERRDKIFELIKCFKYAC